MIVRRASDLDVVLVARNLRALNAEEVLALRGTAGLETLGRDMNLLSEKAGTFRLAFLALSREPVAVLSCFQLPDAPPGHAAMHLMATDKWPEHGRAIYRFMRESVVPHWFPLHRIVWAATDVLVRPGETAVNGLSRGPASRKWLRNLGFADEGPSAPLGRNGELFQRVVWRASPAAIDAAGGGLVSVA